jgi:hypothetical protein
VTGQPGFEVRMDVRRKYKVNSSSLLDVARKSYERRVLLAPSRVRSVTVS